MGGLEQLRRVCLDDQRLALLNFDTKMRLKKILPIANIVQVRSHVLALCTNPHCLAFSCDSLNKATQMFVLCRYSLWISLVRGDGVVGWF